jgi:hypothetical protein
MKNILRAQMDKVGNMQEQMDSVRNHKKKMKKECWRSKTV